MKIQIIPDDLLSHFHFGGHLSPSIDSPISSSEFEPLLASVRSPFLRLSLMVDADTMGMDRDMGCMVECLFDTEAASFPPPSEPVTSAALSEVFFPLFADEPCSAVFAEVFVVAALASAAALAFFASAAA